ncbi:uncharacterized protein HMPREF1541_03028 [Cyphellophora europaea CBS 101466]|uniref:Malonyl-CoA:ACP transacylase (MAT) domain-containing protein n=1 Tax=Cyphellophora europaea (strain CBS 101466) TaxID=1220924 RepID=W2RZ91_CYPE1|nr:uncharacterized protein HMPREF1541_03028 [Cyphellophora europaea CBS 101466]ETN41093.1 hypothetical protein HMPREF1541_03028 [Cyphellophora europaea CBS 101466]
MTSGSDHTDASSHSFSIIQTPEVPRLIDLTHGSLVYQWSIPGSQHGGLTRSRDHFLASLSASEDETPLSAPELVARFILYLIQHNELWDEATSTARIESIELLFRKFETDFLRGKDIHTFVAKLPGKPSQRQTVLQAYMAALASSSISSSQVRHEAALFSQANDRQTNTYAIFGGQGNTTDYFSELLSLYATYTHQVEPLIVTATQTFHELLHDASVTCLRQFHQGLDILQWLLRPETMPEPEYLLSAPVSFPIIGLVQFANYAVLCRCLDKTPGEITEHFLGLAGHSQGVIVAATLATVSDWESFDIALAMSLRLLFHVGSAAQEATPQVSVPSLISTETMKHGEGFPTPMLNVSGCSRTQLEWYLKGINDYLEPHQRVWIGLINSQSNFVVSGPMLSLCALTSNLRQVKAAPGADQGKVAYSMRKPEFSLRFLPISAPFHSVHLESAVFTALQALSQVHIDAGDLQVPVYHSHTGEDLRKKGSGDVVPDLVRMILCELDDWTSSTKFPDATHVLDFGPGGISGVGALLHRNKEGTGLRLIIMGQAEGTSTEFGYRYEAFQSAPVFGDNWSQLYSPKLIQSKTGVKIDNKMTRLLSLPPLMVAGMTPTTVSWEFVSAIINAGYHTELAGGGLHNAQQMTSAIKNLVKSIPAGHGICINVIYASPKQVRWQVPLIQKLRSEGVPIDGLTFGAGVPSVEVAKEYVELGLRYLSFKPGSAFAINQVIAIARTNKSYPILLQWTGGRGGGHHSYEDFHDPILKLYGRIRRCPNIVLLAGSGFGGAEDTYQYLTGSWSLPLGYPPMPFDGVLFGSRMMVAKEAKTSRGAKEAIVAAPGVEDQASWEQSYNKPTGGIINVRSEMGEPIHKIATRGVLLWREMDEKIFSISDKPKRLEKLRSMKSYIIQRLNDDFQKVWFGRDSQGNVVDLEDMTYAEVLRRLIELLYVEKKSRWVDPSYMRLTADFVRRMFARLLTSMPRFETNFGLQTPLLAVPNILSHCPQAEKQIISYNDARYFVLLCKRQGQKPPTFIPDLDDDFEVWFKKDSLWQSEDLAAVVGEDAGRTCILQGPVAARYSTRIDEPIAHILNNINQGHISKILESQYAGDVGRVPATGLTTPEPTSSLKTPAHCFISHEGQKAHYRIASSIEDDQLPETSHWLRLLAGRPGTWLHSLLLSEDITQGSKVVANPIRRVLSPTQGMHVEVTEASNPEDLAVAILESNNDSSLSPTTKYSTVISKDKDILVTFYTDESVERVSLPLTFKFTYHPDMVMHPIHELMAERNDRLRKFYYRLWFGTGQQERPVSPQGLRKLQRRPTRPFDTSFPATVSPTKKPPKAMSLVTGGALKSLKTELETPLDLQGASFNTESPTNLVFKGRELTVSSPSIQDFSDSIEQSHQAISARSDKSMASLDFAIVVGWEAMMKAIFPSAIDGEFLNLVHLSNKFRILNDSTPLSSLDQINSNAEILAIRNEPAGRVVEVGAIIERDGSPVLELVSEFLFRGTYTDYSVCFEKKSEPKMLVKLDSAPKIAVLKSKNWISLKVPEADLLGLTVIFELKSLNRLEADSAFRSVQTFGQVYFEDVVTKTRNVVATVHYQSGKSASNPVTEYLKRQGSGAETFHHQENAQPLGESDWLRITTPATNQAYARASGDYNPIHVSRPFAKYANLPGTITHGMYTSAAVRQLVEKAAGSNESVRMRSYKASFTSMVLPGDTLEVQVSHVAMKEGLRVLSFQAVNVATGDKVLVGEAEVDQPLTTYIFTGQGSQKPEMGMDLYATSEVAKAVWDEADRFYSQTYGFLISEIVKHNPKVLTVYFGGRRGAKIRQSYMEMTVESNGKPEKFFESINKKTTKYTFTHNAGLLFSTEFAQPALTVMERAQYLHLKSKGIVSPNALFAGHSLGEYTALSSIGEIMSFEKLLSVVFYRGLTMQSAVNRDASGRSRFSMMAVNPSRISKMMSTQDLQDLITKIATALEGDLLEIVNYNVATQQYVVAGTLATLDCLAAVCNHMAANAKDFHPSNTAAATNLDNAVTTAAAKTELKPFPIPLKRGVATVPLEGIDVPFHSSFLLPKMPAFRRVLERYITREAIDARLLKGKYVSNVTGKAFDTSYEAVQEMYETTGSVVLKELLEEMEGYA